MPPFLHYTQYLLFISTEKIVNAELNTFIFNEEFLINIYPFHACVPCISPPPCCLPPQDLWCLHNVCYWLGLDTKIYSLLLNTAHRTHILFNSNLTVCWADGTLNSLPHFPITKVVHQEREWGHNSKRSHKSILSRISNPILLMYDVFTKWNLALASKSSHTRITTLQRQNQTLFLLPPSSKLK